MQGTSCQLPTWSNVEMVGDRPPWTQKIRLSITADKLRGKQAVGKTTKSALSGQGIKELHPCGLTHAPEVVKHICAVPPHVDGPVLAQALVIEPIDLCAQQGTLSCSQ